MSQIAARCRIWNIIAIFVMVLGALIPSLGQAFVAQGAGHSDMSVVCTTTGMKFVKLLDSGDRDHEDSRTAQVIDCPLCLWNTHTLGLGGAPFEFTPLKAASAPYQPHCTSPHVSPRVWLSPQPRAPPFSS